MVLRTLRGGEPRRRGALQEVISAVWLHCFGNQDGLTDSDCRALLTPASAARVLAHAPVMRACLASPLPISIVNWCLARVVEVNRPLAPVALGLLVADLDRLGTAADAVSSAWGALRERNPSLPNRPAGLVDLRQMARQDPYDHESESVLVSDPTAPAVADGTVSAGHDLQQMTDALDKLRLGLQEAADAADRAAADLRAGRRPGEHDIILLGEAVTDFDALHEQVAAIAQGAEPAADLAVLATVLEAARSAEAHAGHVRRLTGLQGPEAFAEAIETVRRMARSASGSGLADLAELIEPTEGPDAFERTHALAESARQLLPDGCRKLVDLALMGGLTIGEPPAEGGAMAGASTAIEAPTTADPGKPRVEASPANDSEPTPASEESRLAEDELDELDAYIAESFPGIRSGGPKDRHDSGDRADGEVTEEGIRGGMAAEPAPEEKSVPKEDTPSSESAEPGAAGDVDQDEGEAARKLSAAVVAMPEFAAAEAAALSAGRLGLAGWMRTAAGRPIAEEAARRCAAIAAEMAVFAGPLSAEFAAAAVDVNAEALADDPAGRLLMWGAAIRGGLIHPTPESTRLLEELAVFVSGHPALVHCGDAFARAARSGAYLGSGIAGHARGRAETAMIRAQAAREAARLLEEEPRRRINYQLATEVWKALVLPQGTIGRLLAIAAQDDPAGVVEATQEITRLRANGEIDRMIDETHRRIAARRRAKKIIGGARAQLISKAKTAIDTVGEWVRAVKETAAPDATATQDWRLGALGKLQESVIERRAEIMSALDELASSPDGVSAAAAEATRGLLMQTLDMLDGASVPQTEPAAAHVLNRDLLLAPDVAVQPASFEPVEPPSVDQLMPVARADDQAWRAAFEQRAQRGDHEGTLGIITVLEHRQPELAAELRERREALIASTRKATDVRIDKLRDRVAGWARDGVLAEHEVRRADETLGPLTGERRDFDRIGRSLDELAVRLEEWRATAIECERARLDEQARDDAQIAAFRDRIAERIDDGDLTTAREYLAQIRADRQLHEAPEGIDHLERFYPAFPSAFADDAARAGNQARRQETSEFLNVLKNALNANKDVDDSRLAELLHNAGINIPAIRNARRAEAGEALRQWAACGLGRNKTAGNLRTAVAGILRMIGLEGAQRHGPEEPHRKWIDLEQVRMVGDALLPAFGSRMSPSGDRLRLLLVWRRPGPQKLIELLKEQPEDQTVLVWYFGVLSPEERQQLAAAARRRPAPVAGVLDDVAVAYLACMPEPYWATAVALMAPFTGTDPYAPVGDVPDEMFYGRADQLREVTDRTGSSFVYGGRQLGKSALLRKAERHIQATAKDRKIILENIQTVGKVAPLDSLWSKLADKLVQAGVISAGPVRREQVRDAVRAWIRKDPQRQLLILLDEADHFLNWDAKGAKFENVIALRDLMNETDRRVKVVFAGLHQTARFQSLTNQPLAHLGTPIAVGPLEPQDAFNLLVRPLETLGFRFPETLAARVIAEANNAPALVQLFAEALLKRMRRDPRATRHFPCEITPADVSEVWRDKKLARGFRDRFEWTLNLDKRYKVIAYTVALHALADGADATLSVGELSEQCRYWWESGFEDCTGDGFRSLLDECVNLGVLGLDADRYRLRTPHILNLLGGTAEVEDVLQNAGEFERPDSFDAHSYRGIFKDGPERSPFSSRQLTALLRPHDLVHVVAGSRALHVERVTAALESEESGHPGVKILPVGTGQGLYPMAGALSRANRHDGHTVIVANMPVGKTAQQVATRVREARDAVAAPHQGTLAIVLVTGAGLASSWLDLLSEDGVDVVELRRFDQLAIRQWMWEDANGFPGVGEQEELLRLTGGWPKLIGQVVNRLNDNGEDRDQALAYCREQLRTQPAALVSDTGVRADACLAAAWQVLVTDIAPEGPQSPDDLADLLTMHGDEGAPGLTLQALVSHGYSGTADLVQVLRILGALEPIDGLLRCEPVLAEATRAAEER
ncbi:AAA domain-containing protein [Actinomadura mexicana]|uniref:AAA domain-containing protein n=2 Tax=Actinomadura mexicana TaxID=134959 RepID=A0A238VPC3_9ACTN|nr:AAA domain-containing protein [Actinomadura mexicana]